MELFQLVDMLPETEQNLIAEMIKRIVLAWDPDFTKVTPEEKKILDKADEELKNGEYYSHDEVWADI